MNAMRWIVGVDFGERSTGASRFARWLSQRTQAHEFVATHVLEGVRPDSPESRKISPDDFQRHLFDELRQQLDVREPSTVFVDQGLIEATTAEDGLEGALEQTHSRGLIVGRRAKASDDVWVRLGRVSRRLLRSLPAPVVVVPPDFAEPPSPGPVLLCTDLAPNSDAAARFARGWARDLGVGLDVLHVVEPPRASAVAHPADSWRAPPADEERKGRRVLVEAWARERALESAEILLGDGNVIAALRNIIEERGSSAVVCGSRGLSSVERIFGSSVASALAGFAPVPVAVIPGDWSPG